MIKILQVQIKMLLLLEQKLQLVLNLDLDNASQLQLERKSNKCFKELKSYTSAFREKKTKADKSNNDTDNE